VTDDSRRPVSPVRIRAVSPIYPIIDVDLCRHRGVDPPTFADACLRGGATLLQIRQKSGSSGAFLTLVREVVARGRDWQATILVNDRADLARMGGADGVHVGQDDLPVAAVRRVSGDRAVVGLSTHTPRQVDEAIEQGVDYVAVGPIFSTATKDTGYTARGLDLVRYAVDRRIPVVAIGGITIENAPAVIAAGAITVAVISDLLSDADPEARVRQYLNRLH
jgi:thiamine-phosphate pyrophosphorylase